MDRKAGEALQEGQKYQVHQVFVVMWEIQVLEVKRGPLLMGPQALQGHLE